MVVNLFKKEKSFICFLVLISLIVGLFWVAHSWSRPLGSDEVDYYKIGKNIYQSRSFSSNPNDAPIKVMNRPPVYPSLISLFYFANLENPNFIRLFQIFFFIGIIILIYFIAKLIFNEKIARMSSVLASVFPALGVLTGYVFTEIIFIFLMLSAVYCLILFLKKQNYNFAFYSGILFGFSALTRPVFLFFPVLFFLILLITNKLKFNKIIKGSLIILFLFSIIITPWLIRNYIQFKQINISDVGSVMLYNRAYRIHYYTNKETKFFTSLSILGSYLTKKIYPDYDYYFSKFEPHVFRRTNDFPDKPARQWNIDSTEDKKILFDESKTLILHHPIRYIAFSFLEFFRIHTPLLIEYSITDLFANTHLEIPNYLKTLIIISIRIAYLAFFVVVFYGIIASYKKIKLVPPILIIISYIILLFCLMETIPRYSIPLYPFYFMFFSFGILNLFKNHITKYVHQEKNI